MTNQTKQVELILGDCLEKMRDIPDGSIDAIITDPNERGYNAHYIRVHAGKRK